jgi:hypothetical protein
MPFFLRTIRCLVVFQRNPCPPVFSDVPSPQEYLTLRQVPKELANKIRFQCIHKWKHTVFDEEQLMKVKLFPRLPPLE